MSRSDKILYFKRFNTNGKNELDSTLRDSSPSFSTVKNGLLNSNMVVHP